MSRNRLPPEIDITPGSTKALNAVASGFMTLAISQASNALDALSMPNKIAATQGIMSQNPLILPDVGVIIEARNREIISEEIAGYGLRAQGINIGSPREGPMYDNSKTLWNAARKIQQDSPSTGFVLGLVAKGYLEPGSDRYNVAMKYAGGNPSDFSPYLTSLYSFPSVEELTAAVNRGFITVDQWHEGLSRNGYGLSWVRAAYSNLREKIPPLGDLIEGLNRRFITLSAFKADLKGMGFDSPSHRDLYNGLLDRLPGPQEWVHFAVKEALSVELANRIKLYDEYPAAITPYMEGNGLDWELEFNIVADGINRKAKVSDLYWAAHWQPISPSQAYDMFHLLRANRLGRYAAAGVPATEFTLQDVEFWLRINDYPKTVRDNLLALSFTPLRLVDIRNALALKWRLDNQPGYADSIPADIAARIGRFNRAWGVEQFRDRGVLPEDANVQVDLVYATTAANIDSDVQSIRKSARRNMFNATRKMFVKGMLDFEQAVAVMVEIGIPDSTARTYLLVDNANWRMHRVDYSLRALRRGYLSGAIDGQRVIDGLLRAGVNAARADEYLALWYSEFDTNRKHASTEKILGWLAKGGITVEQARERLVNLGWENPDLQLLIVESLSKLRDLNARQVKALQADRAKRLKELSAVQREAQRLVDKTQALIRRQTPVSTMQRLFKRGVYNHAQFIARMVAAGYPADVAEQYARDAIENVPIPTLQRWLRKREISEDVFIKHLVSKGVSQEEAAKYALDAITPEPQKLYPKPPPGTTTKSTAELPTPPTQPVQPPTPPVAPPEVSSNATAPQQLHTEPAILNTQPEQLHTVPSVLGQGNQ